MSKPIQIVVDSLTGPVAGSSLWNTTLLAGLDGYLEKTGYGTMKEEDYTITDTGGIQLNNGLKFESAASYFFHTTGSSAVPANSSYTNGFDFNRVMAAMQGRLAMRGEEPASKSGRYFQDFHAVVTPDNIRATMPSGAVFATYITQLQQAAILRILNGVFRQREFYENVLLYEREDAQTRLIPNTGYFTGYELEIASDGKRAVQVDAVVLNFNEDITFPLYLFKDGKKTPIWQQTVSAVAGEATVVPLDNLVLTYLAGNTKGGRFYLGYFQSDLGTAKAIEEQVDDWAPRKMFSASPFYSIATGNDFDRVLYQEQAYPYGLNLEVSSFRDHTAAIVSRANVFDEAVGLQFSYLVIEQILYAVRSNASERILKGRFDDIGLQLELNGYVPVTDTQKVEGITQRIKKEIDRLSTTFFPNPKAMSLPIC